MPAIARNLQLTGDYGNVAIDITVDGGAYEVNEDIARKAIIGAHSTMGNINSRLMMFAEPSDQLFDSSVSTSITVAGITATVTARYSYQSSPMLVLAGCLEQVGSACSSAISGMVPLDQERIAKVMMMNQAMMQPQQVQSPVQAAQPQPMRQAPMTVTTQSGDSSQDYGGQYL